MKSVRESSFYLPGDSPDRVGSTLATAGPWSSSAQHGGPPAALLARALEGLLDPGQVVGRLAMDLLGPVPVGPLRMSAEVLRAGRSVSLLGASLHDETAGRPCATARAWAFPRSESGPGDVRPLAHKPDDGVDAELPPTWSRGYVDHVEWRWIDGAFLRPGAATVWLRPLVPLLPDEELTGLQLLMACVDSASGVSAALDPAEWGFLNTELTVHVLREPVGEWVCLEAETTLAPSSVGVANARVYDERGLVATSAQALLVTRR